MNEINNMDMVEGSGDILITQRTWNWKSNHKVELPLIHHPLAV